MGEDVISVQNFVVQLKKQRWAETNSNSLLHQSWCVFEDLLAPQHSQWLFKSHVITI